MTPRERIRNCILADVLAAKHAQRTAQRLRRMNLSPSIINAALLSRDIALRSARGRKETLDSMGPERGHKYRAIYPAGHGCTGRQMLSGVWESEAAALKHARYMVGANVTHVERAE